VTVTRLHLDQTRDTSATVYTHGFGGKDQEVFATLSHEVLEDDRRPRRSSVRQHLRPFAVVRHSAFVGVEVCDAVQFCYYEIDGIQVSDSVVPEWFETDRAPGSMKFSFRGNVDGPLKLAKTATWTV